MTLEKLFWDIKGKICLSWRGGSQIRESRERERKGESVLERKKMENDGREERGDLKA